MTENIVARASVNATCFVHALGRTVNVPNALHTALSRNALQACHDAWEKQGKTGLARVMRDCIAVRQVGALVTGPIDYVVGTGKVCHAPGAGGVRAAWRRVVFPNTQTADAPNTHQARLNYLLACAQEDLEHPANLGITGDMVATECRVRARVLGAVGGILGGAVGALVWAVRRPCGWTQQGVRAAVGDGVVIGAALGAGVAAVSMLGSMWFGLQTAGRVVSAAIKGVLTGLGLLVGVLDLAAVSAYGACRGCFRGSIASPANVGPNADSDEEVYSEAELDLKADVDAGSLPPPYVLDPPYKPESKTARL